MSSTILSIFIGSFLVGAIFVPTLQKLRELLLKFSDLTLPFVDPKEKFGLVPAKTSEQREAEDEQAAISYNGLFREYIIQYASFRRVATAFLIALLLMITTAAWQSSCVWQRALWALFGNSLALLAAAYLKPTIAPHPEDILTIDNIGKQFANLNYISALRLANIRVWCWHQNEGKLPFRMRMDIWLSGFKFLLAVTDHQNKRLYLACYGGISGKTKYSHVLDPGATHFAVDLASLNYSALPEPKPQLKMTFWVFVPLPETWTQLGENSPSVLTSHITEQMGEQTGFLLNFPSLDINYLDKKVHFNTAKNWLGRKTWIINTSEGTDPALRRFVSKLAGVKGIETKMYLNGLDLGG